jgi:hypothetical protein
MLRIAKIVKPYYDFNGRKYMWLDFDENVYTVKVPFRYNRVMCHVSGLKTIQEYTQNEIVMATLDKRMWNNETHYVLIALSDELV